MEGTEVEPMAEAVRHYGKPTGTSLPISEPAALTTSFEYDDYNKLTEITFPDSATETLSYDDNGQLVRREKSTGETTNYQWNDQGMLVKVILPTGEPVNYKYDGTQRLVGRSDSGGEDVFVQSGWDIMTKMDDVGKRTYYTGMSAVVDEDNQTYFHYNHRGDTVLVTDSEGNTLNNFSYEAYGKVTNAEGIPVNNLSIKNIPNLFVGGSGIRYDTKTNLHYMRFRWFSQDQMRFISPDLLIDLNRYAYVEGNPITRIDPAGLEWWGGGYNLGDPPIEKPLLNAQAKTMLLYVVVGGTIGGIIGFTKAGIPGAFAGAAIGGTIFYLIPKLPRFVARSRGVPKKQVDEALRRFTEELDEDLEDLCKKRKIKSLKERAKRRNVAIGRAKQVIGRYLKGYEVNTSFFCGYAHVDEYADLDSVFNYPGSGIRVFPGRVSNVMDNNYVYVKIDDVYGAFQFYLGSDADFLGKDKIKFLYPQYYREPKDTGY